MNITKEILRALELAIEKAGTQEILSKHSGVRQDFFSKCLNHKVKTISLEKWLKLAPYFEPHLPGYEEKQKKWKDFMSEKQKLALLTRICSYVYEDNTGERIGKIYEAIGNYIEGQSPYLEFDDVKVDLQSAIFRHPLLSVKKREELIAELRKLEKEKIELLELKLKISADK